MSVQRTIYTQGAVNIQAPIAATWFAPGVTGAAGLFLSGVQSANYTVNSPKQDVSSFGVLGSINKVQVEPTTATIEISIVVNSGNTVDGINWLSGLTTDSQQPAPSGITVTASGIGQVLSAVLTSFRLETAVGSLSTLAVTFDGISGAPQETSAPAAPTTPNVAVVPVVTPDAFGTLYWAPSAPGNATGCPQSVRVSWEMPIERLNCLGNDINKPTIFTRPPGTMSFTVEGIDPTLHGHYLTGVQVGPYKVTQSSGTIKETARTSNMAVGEAAATFNTTSEGVALGATIQGS